MPSQVPSEARAVLLSILEGKRARLRDDAVNWIIEEAVDLDGRRPRAETESLVEASFEAWESYLFDGDYGPLAAFIETVVAMRGSHGFRLSTPQRGLLGFKKALAPHIARLPPSMQVILTNALDEAYERALFDLSDAWQEHIVAKPQRLAARAAKLQQAQTAFLASVGHEIRTPLSSMLGFAQLLQSSSGHSREDMETYLESLKLNAQRMLELVDDLVDLARLEQGAIGPQPEDLDLWRLVQDVHEDLRTAARGRVKGYELELTVEVPRYARVDGRKLARALRSVLRAALGLSPAIGGVYTRIELAEEGLLRARIHDHGREPLPQRVDWLGGLNQEASQRAGPGLAIAVAARLAECLDGTLSVDGRPGDFEWQLLIPLGPLADVASTAEPSLPIATVLRRVLVLTGPNTPAPLLTELFAEAGIETDFVPGDGIIATESRPDVVLCESGATPQRVASTREIPSLCDVPIVAATSTRGDKLRDELLAAGAYDVVAKPLDLDELMTALLSAAAAPTVSVD